tara:strand:+ start:339 stop:725 length:387 start_codon:yes stop_codon:yes gene_type:complete
MPAHRGKKRKTPRRRKSFSVTNAIFSLGFASIITQGIFRNNILSFFLEGSGFPGTVSGGGISLKEIINSPGKMTELAIGNAKSNLVDMVFKSMGLAVTERVFKKLMAMPLRRINSGLVTPLLGRGVRL